MTLYSNIWKNIPDEARDSRYSCIGARKALVDHGVQY